MYVYLCPAFYGVTADTTWEEEGARVAADFFGEYADELAQRREAGVTGAQGDTQRQSEADPEVHQADGDDGKEAIEEGADAFGVAGGGVGEVGRGEGDVADVQRQFQYFPDPRGDAEQDAKEEVAGERAEVVVDEVGKSGAGGGG